MTEENTTEEVDLTVYELGYHLLPTLAADAVDAGVGTLRAAIEKHNGAFIAEGTPESIDLAYTITKSEGGKHTHFDKAHFGWIKFEMAASEVPALRELLEGDKNLLRFVLFKTVREDTRADVQIAHAGVLREVATVGTIEKPATAEEEKGEISEEAIDRSIEELVSGESETATKSEAESEGASKATKE